MVAIRLGLHVQRTLPAVVIKRCDDRRVRDVTLLALKNGERGSEPMDVVGPRGWEMPGSHSPLWLQQQIQPCRHLDFGSVKPVLDL